MCDHLNEHKNFHFDNEQEIQNNYKLIRGKWLRPSLGFANCLVLIMYFHVLGEVASKKKQLFKTRLPYLYMDFSCNTNFNILH